MVTKFLTLLPISPRQRGAAGRGSASIRNHQRLFRCLTYPRSLQSFAASRPVPDKHFMTEAEVDAQRKLVNEAARLAGLSNTQQMRLDRTPIGLLIGAWVAVGVPV